jgi:hypothetical protein
LQHQSGSRPEGRRPIFAAGLLQPLHFPAATFRRRFVGRDSREGITLSTDINPFIILGGLFFFPFLLTIAVTAAHIPSPLSLVEGIFSPEIILSGLFPGGPCLLDGLR